MYADRKLQIFMAVAESRSFTAAARALDMSQASVSQAVAELERIYDTKFFERTKQSVNLTPKGELLKGYASQILHWYGVADEAFRNPTVFQLDVEPPKPLVLDLGEKGKARIWSSMGDIHISVDKEPDR